MRLCSGAVGLIRTLPGVAHSIVPSPPWAALLMKFFPSLIVSAVIMRLAERFTPLWQPSKPQVLTTMVVMQANAASPLGAVAAGSEVPPQATSNSAEASEDQDPLT